MINRSSLCAAAALGLCLVSAVAEELASLPLDECRIADVSGTRTIAARCGHFEVAEDPTDPGGKAIDLFVAVIPALKSRAERDPFTVIAGGPGQASSEFYVSYQSLFARIQRNHDILLVDQRGTGQSNPLDCREPDALSASDWTPESIRANTLECLDQLKGDPRFYTTSIAVQDLDAVREALGYGRLNIYGVSYGTRVGLHYLRRYPGSVRTLVLDGVVPADLALGPGIALVAQDALDMVFERCETSETCSESFPRLRETFSALHARLSEASVEVALPDPFSAEAASLEFGAMELAGAIRLLSYSPDTVSLMPLLVSQAFDGNYVPLTAQAMMVSRGLSEQLSHGMHNAVVCTEDVPFFTAEQLDAKALRRTYIGTLQVDALREICQMWPEGVRDEDFKTPVVSDAPVLLFSGSADPVTPPKYGDRAEASLSNARHIVIEGQGHAQVAVGCTPLIIEEFLEASSVLDLDVSCLDRQQPAPFFTSFSGPPP